METVAVSAEHARYDVVLGTGVLEELPTLLHERCPATRYAVIADSQVAPIYGRRITNAVAALGPSTLITFPAGEWNKSRETWSDLIDQLLKARCDRTWAIVAVGGGVTGDLAGFVAATYLHGIPYVFVPTTLVAMADSSVGGRTGVDAPNAKNTVGTYHAPRAVIADVNTLTTLPPVHVAAGIASAMRYGVIASAEHFEELLAHRDAIRRREVRVLLDVVRRSVKLKSALLSAVTTGRESASVLGFGRTFAWALENVLGYELLHGEAVGIGVLVESRLGETLGVTDAGIAEHVRAALEQCGLPTEPPGAVDHDRLWDSLTQGTQTNGESVRFALLRRIGELARGPAGEDTFAASREVVDRTLTALF